MYATKRDTSDDALLLRRGSRRRRRARRRDRARAKRARRRLPADPRPEDGTAARRRGARAPPPARPQPPPARRVRPPRRADAGRPRAHVPRRLPTPSRWAESWARGRARARRLGERPVPAPRRPAVRRGARRAAQVVERPGRTAHARGRARPAPAPAPSSTRRSSPASSRLGVRLSLDDGGRAASFAALRVLPLDELKIDAGFVHGLGRSATDAALVHGMIDIGHALGLTVVAEGVETREAWSVLAGGAATTRRASTSRARAPADELERVARGALAAGRLAETPRTAKAAPTTTSTTPRAYAQRVLRRCCRSPVAPSHATRDRPGEPGCRGRSTRRPVAGRVRGEAGRSRA